MKKLSKIIAIFLLASSCFMMSSCTFGDVSSSMGGTNIESSGGDNSGEDDSTGGDNNPGEDDSTGGDNKPGEDDSTGGDNNSGEDDSTSGENGGNWTGEVPLNGKSL